jgi:hypothetical protein
MQIEKLQKMQIEKLQGVQVINLQGVQNIFLKAGTKKGAGAPRLARF